MHANRLITKLLFVVATILAHTVAFGYTHTWIPGIKTAQDGDPAPDETIVITGTTIKWGVGKFDIPFTEDPNLWGTTSWGSPDPRVYLAQIAVSYSDICQNPILSTAFKKVTSLDDVTTRWLAATELVATIQLKGLWNQYQTAYSNINIIIDSKSYQGFKVTYADGAKETWVLTPNSQFSVAKLFDQPAPNSLTQPPAGRTGCPGAG